MRNRLLITILIFALISLVLIVLRAYSYAAQSSSSVDSTPPGSAGISSRTGTSPGTDSQRCPTPQYPSEAHPPEVQIYPGATEAKVQEFSPPVVISASSHDFEGFGAVYLDRTTSFTTTEDFQAVRAFYEQSLKRDRWLPDDRTNPDNRLHYFWGADVAAWQAPPCNATPETGLPQFVLELSTEYLAAGGTRVELLQGHVPGY